MKRYFYLGLLGLLLFEFANVYFIMPLPGSQQMNSIGLAYFLYQGRWFFRTLFILLCLMGLLKAQWKRKWSLLIPITLVGFVVYTLNFDMAADAMFKQPKGILLASEADNKVDTNRLIIGVVDHGLAKAYPIQFLGYHHFVYDTLNKKPILVTYCTVCRSGRVFDPTVNGKVEQFRLVGMDHFNAMIEDETTKSWWRQNTGEAISGQLKGKRLNEIHSTQVSLAQWLKLYPNSLIMQADPSSVDHYDTSFRFESGESKSVLTGTDSLSWQRKSWVVGLRIKQQSIVFDWNELKQKRVLSGKIGKVPVFVVLANDNKSFFAYENHLNAVPKMQHDTLFLNGYRFALDGHGMDSTWQLKPVYAYQEFWHSWETFQATSKPLKRP